MYLYTVGTYIRTQPSTNYKGSDPNSIRRFIFRLTSNTLKLESESLRCNIRIIPNI